MYPLPLPQAIAFLEGMTRSQGIDDLGLRGCQHLTMTDFSEPVRTVLSRSPTLMLALEGFRQLAYLEDSNFRFWIGSEETTIKLHWSTHVRLGLSGVQWEDWVNALTLVAVVRVFTGSTWQPDEIGLRSNLPLARVAFEQFPNTRFHIDQDAAWITVPRRVLSLPSPSGLDATGARHTSRSMPSLKHDAPTVDFLGALKRVLATYLPGSYVPITLAAEFAVTSERTLQRCLQHFNMTYRDLVDQVRFEVAARMLRESDRRIIDIGYEVGYEDGVFCTSPPKGIFQEELSVENEETQALPAVITTCAHTPLARGCP
jgi:AraC-like DNA-binding protein